MASRRSIPALLDKIPHYDKDERFMAISDLIQALEKESSVDTGLEARICDAILERLNVDTCNDVQAVSVKCLSVLVTRVQEVRTLEVAEKLCERILEGKADLRDIYSIGLKTLIADIPESSGDRLATIVTKSLMPGLDIRSSDPPDAVGTLAECLDIIGELLKRFGQAMEPYHANLLKQVLRHLSHPQSIVRKRATTMVGVLGQYVSDPLLQNMIRQLLAGIQKPAGGQDVRTLIQTVGTVSRQVGYRLGKHLPDIVPLFLSFVSTVPTEAQDESADDLRENCLQALESFVLRCPGEATEFLPAMLQSVRKFVQFDPNYTYDEEDEEEEEDDEDYSGDEYDDMGGYSDDGDSSWKVRRASVKLLAAIIASRPELLRSMYDEWTDTEVSDEPLSHARQLIDRFKDREESVKLDVIQCFTDLLRATVVVEGVAAYSSGLTTKLNDPIGHLTGGTGSGAPEPTGGYGRHAAAAAGLLQPARLVRQRSCFDDLRSLMPAVQAAALKLLNTRDKKDVKVKIAVWTMLRQLALAMGEGMSETLPTMLPAAAASLRDQSSSALRLEALLFVRMLLDTNRPEVFHPHLPSLVEAVTACSDDDWYKIVAESLRVIGRLAVAMRLRDVDGTFKAQSLDPAPMVEPMYAAVITQLAALDIDQEIKESAITSMGLVLAHVGDFLTEHLKEVLPLFLDRLRNEITRTPVLKALSFVAESPLTIDMSATLADTVAELGGFLRQQARALKQATLKTLQSLMQRHGSSVDVGLLSDVLAQTANMVDDTDLQLSHLALELCVSVMEQHPKAADLLRTTVLPRALTLSRSSLLQGDALTSLQAFFKGLLKLGGAGLSYDKLMEAVLSVPGLGAGDVAGGAGAGEGGAGAGSADGGQGKQATSNVARVAAAIAVQGSAAELSGSVGSLLGQLSGPPAAQLLALYCLGEIGWQVDIPTAHPGSLDAVQAQFASSVEDVKMAAAFALGGLCVGNMATGLPMLLGALDTGANAYLLLTALKEILSRHAPSHPTGPSFESHVEVVMPLLLRYSENPEEGIRNIVAECLGKVGAVAPVTIMPRLLELCASPSPLTRWTIVTSLKYAVVAPATHVALRAGIEQCMALLTDDDLQVRHAAIVTLNAIVHVESRLLAHLVTAVDAVDERKEADEPIPPPADSLSTSGILPILFYEMRLRPSLKREVNLGPFKHTVDDGLPLRKAAFSAIDSILDHMRERVGRAFLPRLRDGLQDENVDVQLLCHQLLTKVTQWPVWQRHLLGYMDQLCAALEVAFQPPKGKAEAGRSDVVRSALRALDALSRIPEVGSIRSFMTLLQRCEGTAQLAPLLESVRAERGSVAMVRASAGAGAGAGAGRTF